MTKLFKFINRPHSEYLRAAEFIDFLEGRGEFELQFLVRFK